MEIAFYSTHQFERPYLEAEKTAKHQLRLLDVALSPHTVVMSKGCEAVSIFVNDDASSEVLELLKLQGVKFLLLRSAGYNNVDITKAGRLGIQVVNVPEYSPYAVAEHTVMLMMALNRKIIRAHNRISDLNFSLDGLVGFDMHGKTVGLIGVGKIGEKVAQILYGFGCKLLAVDPLPNTILEQTIGLKYCSLSELCQQSDIISLHAPLVESTKYVIDKERINEMKDGVMLINTSRGGLINTKAVIKGLKIRKIGFLGLDVYEEEKGLFFEDHSDDVLVDDIIARLMTFPNVLITSHQGFLTRTALQNISKTVFDNLNNLITRGTCDNEL